MHLERAHCLATLIKDGAEMSQLSDREHIRTHPSMYIGDTTTRGLHHLPGELVSNSVDEFLRGRVTKVRVEIADQIISVIDDGPGFPFDQPSQHGNASLADDYMVKFHSQPSADNHAPHVHVHSPIGAGLVVVNALSQWLTIESWSNEKLHRRRFEQGIAQPVDDSTNENDSPFFPSDESVPARRGTRISFWPDPEVFDVSELDAINLRRKLFEAVHLIPGLKIQLQDECYHAPGGLVDLAAFHSYGQYWKTFSFNGEVDNIMVHAVAAGQIRNDTKDTEWLTWANGIKTYYTGSDGTHHDAFTKALENVNWKPSVALIHVIAKEPKYAGPTRTKLDMPEKEAALTDALTKSLKKFEANFAKQ